MSSFTITIENLPSTIKVPLGKDTGLFTEVPVEIICKNFPLLAKQALLNGFTGTLGNISRGWADDAKKQPNSNEVWAASRQKTVDTWLRGEWASKERGDSNMTFVKEQYIFEQIVKGSTTGKIEKSIKETVESTFGKDVKATFENFLKALARQQLGPKADESELLALSDKIETALRTRALKRQMEADKAKDKIKVPDLSELLGIDPDDESEAA